LYIAVNVPEVEELSPLLLCELERLGDPLRHIFYVCYPRREDPVHRPPQDAVPRNLLKNLLHGRRLGRPQGQLKAAPKFV